VHYKRRQPQLPLVLHQGSSNKTVTPAAPSSNRNWTPTLAGRVDPVVEQAIRYLFEAVYSLRDGKTGTLAGPGAKPGVPNVNGYPGLLSQPQKGMAVPVNYKPGIHDILSQPGSIILYQPTSSVYVYDPATKTFRLLGALGAAL